MEVHFILLAERYEMKSVLITSNRVFSQWNQIFKDPMMTMAAVDRLVHHAVILEFNRDTFPFWSLRRRLLYNCSSILK
jgi:DNA replication protein DnaC